MSFELFSDIKVNQLDKGITHFINILCESISEYKKFLTLDNLNSIHKKKFYKEILKKYAEN